MERFNRICENPWCKAPYSYTTDDLKIIDGEVLKPKQCPKCFSFDKDLSGGVTWSDKNYEGSTNEDGPHEIRYKITNFR
jgi:hypothetical protein